MSIGFFVTIPVITAWATETQANLKSTDISKITLQKRKISVTFQPANENEPDNTAVPLAWRGLLSRKCQTAKPTNFPIIIATDAELLPG